MNSSFDIAAGIGVLRRAKALIADPAHWQQGGYGTAEKMCLAGAINLAHGWDVDAAMSYEIVVWDPAIHAVVVEIARRSGARTQIGPFNDTHTHAEIMEVLDAAVLALVALYRQGEQREEQQQREEQREAEVIA